jgi:endonuclease/exonuclease/phosphatase family metal-dependent hydrolase
VGVLRGGGIAAAQLAAALLAAACDAPPPAPAADGPFRVLSFNVRYGTADDGPDAWPLRQERLARAILDAAPDLLGVQEALDFQIAWLEELLPHHRRVGGGRDADGGGEYAALFVDARRFDILAAGDFWLSETPEQRGSVGWDAALPRICTWARLRERDSGRDLTIWNAHFDHRGATARLRSAELIAARVGAAAGPQLVLGDFNAGEDSAPLAALRAAGLRDSYRAVHPDASAVGTFHAFAGGTSGEKIDYVLIGAGLRTLDAAILSAAAANGRWPSDHHPAFALLSFE